jgi:hypothetical protein
MPMFGHSCDFTLMRFALGVFEPNALSGKD